VTDVQNAWRLSSWLTALFFTVMPVLCSFLFVVLLAAKLNSMKVPPMYFSHDLEWSTVALPGVVVVGAVPLQFLMIMAVRLFVPPSISLLLVQCGNQVWSQTLMSRLSVGTLSRMSLFVCGYLRLASLTFPLWPAVAAATVFIMSPFVRGSLEDWPWFRSLAWRSQLLQFSKWLVMFVGVLSAIVFFSLKLLGYSYFVQWSWLSCAIGLIPTFVCHMETVSNLALQTWCPAIVVWSFTYVIAPGAAYLALLTLDGDFHMNYLLTLSVFIIVSPFDLGTEVMDFPTAMESTRFRDALTVGGRPHLWTHISDNDTNHVRRILNRHGF
jgi:hypothetical protein